VRFASLALGMDTPDVYYVYDACNTYIHKNSAWSRKRRHSCFDSHTHS